MPLSLQLGYPDIPKSITNPLFNAADTLDSVEPMSFLTFIKTITVSFEPDALQNYYNHYIKLWNSVSKSSNIKDSNFLVSKYKEFLKDLSLNYTNDSERYFLSRLDFSDPLDLDVAMSFFSKKLLEICDYYKKKRENVKFSITKGKLLGSSLGLSKSITELTLSHLENLDRSYLYYNIEDVKNSIEIEIEELFGITDNVYNQIPDNAVYDKKDLDYGLNLFLSDNQSIIEEAFSELSEDLQNLKEINDLLENKRKLTGAYMSTDFYFLSTGNTTSDIVSGLLFENKNDILNFKNKNYPTTVSSSIRNYLTFREVGFFKPDKKAIVVVDGKTNSFVINHENLQPNSLYYFPDPRITGQNNEVLVFSVDNSFLKRNFSSGNAKNQPLFSKQNNFYNGYTSNIEIFKEKYFDSIFEKGYIKDSKRDIWGNLYGLLDTGNTFNKKIELVKFDDRYNVQFNGYLFLDNLYDEGLSFDYTLEDSITYNETTRTGLSTNCSNFTDLVIDTELNFGRFTPYYELINPTENVGDTLLLEGGYFLKSNGQPYSDPTSSDLSSFSSDTSNFYYTDLYESGTSDAIIPTRALNDPLYPLLSGSLTPFVPTSAYKILDGGNILNDYDFNVYIGKDGYQYINNTNIESIYTENLSDYGGLSGILLIRNYFTDETNHILDELTYLRSKYPPSIVSELLSGVNKFETVNDTLFIETDTSYIVEKLNFNGLEYSDSNNTIYLTFDSNPFNKLSNRIKVGNYVYYTTSNVENYPLSSNDIRVGFEIYEYDMINHRLSRLNDYSYIDFFSSSSPTIRYDYLDSLILSYSSRNNIFNISYLLKDQNDAASLHSIDFEYKNAINWLDHTIRPFAVDSYSNILNNLVGLNEFTDASYILDGEDIII